MRSSREPLIPLNTAKLLFFFHIPYTQPYFFSFALLKYCVVIRRSMKCKLLAIFSAFHPP